MDRLTVLFPVLLTVLHLSVSGVKSTTFTLRNKCDDTVWPGIISYKGVASFVTSGFALQTDQSLPITAPPSWRGRLWGRTLCSQDSAGNFSCLTGDCGTGKYECTDSGGEVPATLVEVVLHDNHSAGGLDLYDVSVVDGYNLPILVAPQGGSGDNCKAAGCVGDVNGACPSELKVMDEKGNVVACKSACVAFASPQYCCTGAYDRNDTCRPSNYSAVFKRACPSAYSYPYDDGTSSFACASANYTITFCPYPENRTSPASQPQQPPGNRRHWKWQVIVGVAGAVIAGLLTICCFIYKLSGWQEKSWLPTKSNQDIEAFLKTHGAVTLKRYKYSDVKNMTNSFKIKLGQGGFGAVYKGNLPNGSNVAVKILNRSKGNGEDFINEVASISRTSHVNVVTLLGFCIENRKKVLIYEFMPNGSLDKFIYNKGHKNTSSLSWDNLYQIAIGVARGLEYLHRGCNTRILHFDIKPHNILLDENFCPKISDFGLAKLCPKKESIISMSNARGTIGYVAPEVWNRHFGGVSHKSDVYSYGMMLLEIVGGRKNINAEASHTDEIYFPHWIYKKLEQGTHLGLDGEVAIEENEVIKRMTMVGLWCIQTIPNDRPTMSRVVEMLEGNMNSLEMPPKPVLSSPTRSVVESSTTVN